MVLHHQAVSKSFPLGSQLQCIICSMKPDLSNRLPILD